MSFAISRASSSVSKGMTTATGPNISSWQIRSELSVVMKSVGSTQNPRGSSGTTTAPWRPPKTSSASFFPISRYPVTRSYWPGETIGPIVVRGSIGSPTTIRLAIASIRPSISPSTLRSTRMRAPATQTWPAFPVKIDSVVTPRAVASRSASASASAKTMLGDLPPSSKMAGVSVSDAAR